MLAAVAVLAIAASGGAAEQNPHPLKPPDRSSPQAALRTYLDTLDQIATVAARAYQEQATLADYRRIRDLSVVALDSLDLSQTAPVARRKFGTAAALYLYETLARLELPPSATQIPSPQELAALPARWTLPDTEITLLRGADGSYRFSPETVAHAATYFERVATLPYVREMPLPDIYRIPAEAAGWMIPLSWPKQLPASLQTVVLGQALWKWIALVALLLVGLLLLRWVYAFSRSGSPEHPFRDALRRLSLPGFLLLATAVIEYLALEQIDVVAEPAIVISYLATGLMHIAGAWIVYRLAPVVAEAMIASPHIATESVDAHLIRIVALLAAIIGAASVLALGADRLGVPLYGVVAGLGIGGLALALSAQPTIENLIGGFSLFADKPVKVGDNGDFGGIRGTVESIGIRSTRIRGKDLSVTTIPNGTLAKASIVNFDRRERLLIQASLGLRYETTPEQLRLVLDRLRELLGADPRIDPASAHVRFVGFGQSTLDVELSAFVRTRNGEEFQATREDLFLRIMEQLEAAGTALAFPSQTHYVAQDPGIRGGGRPGGAETAPTGRRPTSPPPAEGATRGD